MSGKLAVAMSSRCYIFILHVAKQIQNHNQMQLNFFLKIKVEKWSGQCRTGRTVGSGPECSQLLNSQSNSTITKLKWCDILPRD